MNKEDFNKIWKDTSREGILNQFYYEHYELIKYQEVIDKAIKFIDNYMYENYYYVGSEDRLKDILKEVE